jgi:hypothetical protein
MLVMRHAGEEDDGQENGHQAEPGHALVASSNDRVIRSPSDSISRVGPLVPHLLVQDRDGLDTVATALDNPALVGLDL